MNNDMEVGKQWICVGLVTALNPNGELFQEGTKRDV